MKFPIHLSYKPTNLGLPVVCLDLLRTETCGIAPNLFDSAAVTVSDMSELTQPRQHPNSPKPRISLVLTGD